MRFVGRVDAVDHRLELALPGPPGRAQLVAHVGEQSAALPLILFESGGHGVEGLNQRPKFTRTVSVAGHPSRVVAGFEAAGRLDQIAEGQRETARAPANPATATTRLA